MERSSGRVERSFDAEAARSAFDSAVRNQEPDFERFFIARFLGLVFAYPDDTCDIRFEVRDDMMNPQGSLHGGVIATVLDISMGHLLRRTTGVAGATLEMKTQYLSPVGRGAVRAVARFTRRGRSIAFLQSELFDQAGVVAAIATSTWKVPTPKV